MTDDMTQYIVNPKELCRQINTTGINKQVSKVTEYNINTKITCMAAHQQ